MDIALRCENWSLQLVGNVSYKFPSELCVFLQRINLFLPGYRVGVDDIIDFSQRRNRRLGAFVREHTVDDFDKEFAILNDEYIDIFDQDMSQVQIVFGSQEIINEIGSWSRNTFTLDILNLVEMLQNKYRLEFQLDDEESSYYYDEYADEKIFYRYENRYVGYYYEYDDDGEEIPEVIYFNVDDYNFSEGNLVRKSGDLYEFRR